MLKKPESMKMFLQILERHSANKKEFKMMEDLLLQAYWLGHEDGRQSVVLDSLAESLFGEA